MAETKSLPGKVEEVFRQERGWRMSEADFDLMVRVKRAVEQKD